MGELTRCIRKLHAFVATAPAVIVAAGGDPIVWAAVVVGRSGRTPIVRCSSIGSAPRTANATSTACHVIGAAHRSGASVLHVDRVDDWTRVETWAGLRFAWRVHELRTGDGARHLDDLVRDRVIVAVESASARRLPVADLRRLFQLAAYLHEHGLLEEDATPGAQKHPRGGVTVGETHGQTVILRGGRVQRTVADVAADRALAAELAPTLRPRRRAR